MVSVQEQNIRAVYKQSLVEKAEALRDCWKRHDVQQLEGLLHKLTGSAGMYGFTEISAQARDLLNQFEDADTMPDSADFDKNMTDLLAKMASIE